MDREHYESATTLIWHKARSRKDEPRQKRSKVLSFPRRLDGAPESYVDGIEEPCTRNLGRTIQRPNFGHMLVQSVAMPSLMRAEL